jgi:hypothetical protein
LSFYRQNARAARRELARSMAGNTAGAAAGRSVRIPIKRLLNAPQIRPILKSRRFDPQAAPMLFGCFGPAVQMSRQPRRLQASVCVDRLSLPWQGAEETVMKSIWTTRHVHHLGREGSHVMVPLVVLSLLAIGVYCGVRYIEFSELGRTALFYVVMVFVALGVAGLFGAVAAWLRSNGDDAQEGFCFIGALVGAIVFYVALLMT